MLRVGLTGGIGCGKSTVSAMLRELGCRIIDADRIARELAEPGQPALREIVNAFGAGILAPDGRMDRAKMAHLVFHDASKLKTLNHILHPRVLAEQDRLLAEISRTDPKAVVVVEAALLIEAGYAKSLDRLIVVWCTPEQQMMRLTNPIGRGMTIEDAKQRIAAQMPLDEKRRFATDEIDNSGSLAATKRQVEDLAATLKLQASAGNSGTTGGTHS
jgi:dephospho-CoA kinase